MKKNTPPTFGTIKGVLIPNITMMFGVILFLRLGVLTASAGIWTMLSAIALSLLIMILTSFSIGSLATNMKVGAGGIYYIISRTLGIEVGGAVGIVIYFSQLISIALTISGFSISFCQLFPTLPVHGVELGSLLILALISGLSASWALRLQGVILLLLLTSIFSVLLGSAIHLSPPTTTQPFYPGGHIGFWECFAMFYPAMTGIEAGMALSGSLRRPGRSLFYGNLYSLIFVAIFYSILSIFAYNYIPSENLLSDPFAFVEFAKWPALVRLGIWGATLSSALGCLLGAPRMLQSIAQDGAAWKGFARTYGRFQEPRAALAVTVMATAVILYFTTIDQIIPMLTMICLVSYGLLNFVAAFSELMNTPSWRPHRRMPWQLSVIAVGLTVFVMFMIAPGWTFLTLFVLFIAQFILRTRALESRFQDLRDSFIFFISRLTLYRLREPTEHALTWHPQILVLLSAPNQAKNLVQLTHSLTRRAGMLTFATVVLEENQTQESLQATRNLISRYFERINIVCMSEVYPSTSLYEGYIQLVKAYGIGAIQPNTVAIEIQEEAISTPLVELIATCQLMKKNTLLLRDSETVLPSLFTVEGEERVKQIDVWWNPEESENFDLVLSLVTTLTDGLVFQDACVAVKTIVSDENAQEVVKEHLQSYVHASRLNAVVEIYLETDELPAPASLTIVSLSSLTEEASMQEKADYLEYLKEKYQEHSEETITFFVATYDRVNHRALYHPEASP